MEEDYFEQEFEDEMDALRELEMEGVVVICFALVLSAVICIVNL